MARGWESKAIEDQINAHETAAAPAKPPLTALEIEHQTKRNSLILARARTISALEAARDNRYREQLERALAHLDSQIAALD